MNEKLSQRESEREKKNEKEKERDREKQRDIEVGRDTKRERIIRERKRQKDKEEEWRECQRASENLTAKIPPSPSERVILRLRENICVNHIQNQNDSLVSLSVSISRIGQVTTAINCDRGSVIKYI